MPVSELWAGPLVLNQWEKRAIPFTYCQGDMQLSPSQFEGQSLGRYWPQWVWELPFGPPASEPAYVTFLIAVYFGLIFMIILGMIVNCSFEIFLCLNNGPVLQLFSPLRQLLLYTIDCGYPHSH